MQDHVYVIGSPDLPVAKIGVTDDVPRRLRQIQGMSPVPLRVLWKTPGGRDLEKALHQYFHYVREHGEWFRLKDPIAAVQAALRDPALRVQPRRRHTRKPIYLSGPEWGTARPTVQQPSASPGGGWRQPTRIGGQGARVYKALVARLEAGEFPPGTLLPPTAEIAAEYEVPMITAVSALKYLHQGGRIVWPSHGRAAAASLIRRGAAEPDPRKAG